MLDNFNRRVDSILKSISDRNNLQLVFNDKSAFPVFLSENSLVINTSLLKQIANKNKVKDVRGFIYDEAAKALYSDQALSKFLLEYQTFGTKAEDVYKEIFKTIEGIRVRKEFHKSIFEGADSDLREFADKNTKDNINPKDSDINNGQNLLAHLEAHGNSSIEKNPELVEELTDFNRAVSDAMSTEHSAKIASDFFSKYYKSFEKEKSEDKDKGEGDGEGEGTGSPTGFSPQDLENAERHRRDSKSKADAFKLGSGLFSKDTREPRIPEELKFSMQAGRYGVFESVVDSVGHVRDFAHKKVSYTTYMSIKGNLENSIGTLSRKLKNLFILRNKNKFQPNFRSGPLLNINNISRILEDREDVFLKRDKENKKDICATLLVDISGSMNDYIQEDSMKHRPKYQAALDCTIVFAEIFHKLNIPFEILAFTTDRMNDKYTDIKGKYYKSKDRAKMVNNTRIEPLQHLVFKDYNKAYDVETKSMLPTIHGMGNNFDAEAVLWAYERIKKRPNKDKFIFVISDGAPNGDNVRDDLNYGFTKDVIQAVSNKVNLIGIGFGTYHVKEFYRNYVFMDDFKKSQDQFLKLLTKVILDKNTKL